jgi:hypothetical protein
LTHNKIEHYQEQLKLRHYEDMDNVEALVRSTAETINMTKSDYLLALRHIYHNNLVSLREAKNLFREQLRKMIGVHTK